MAIRGSARVAALLLLLCVCVAASAPLVANAFYLPGVTPREFLEKDQVFVKVNKLDSVRTQLPYDYYTLPFCRPHEIQEAAENLGEILSGDRIETSLYEVRCCCWCSARHRFLAC
jgi:transmembrane 9 superfamily protein 2/4